MMDYDDWNSPVNKALDRWTDRAIDAETALRECQLENTMLQGEVKRLTDERDHFVDSLLYDAWCLIANAHLGSLNWYIDGKQDHLTLEERQWVKAAEEWRDAWQGPPGCPKCDGYNDVVISWARQYGKTQLLKKLEKVCTGEEHA